MLDRLSADLVELVVGLLDNSSFLAFRGVCRLLFRASYDLFARDWFEVLWTDFTPHSLRRVSRISQSREIASRVRRLRVSRWDRVRRPSGPILDLPDDDGDDELDGIREPWPRGESGCLDLNSQQARGLKDVLLRFTHCTEIDFIISCDEVLWSPLPPDRLQLNPVDIFWFILSLLKPDGGLQVQRFIVRFYTGFATKKESGWPSSPELFQLLSQSAWASHLRRLAITWDFRDSLADVMLPLITTAAHLESLTLHHGCDDNELHAFVAQLAGASPLPSLSRLKLIGGQRLSPIVLPKLIGRFQHTLESLWMQHVDVAGDAMGDVLRQLAALYWPALRCVTVKNCACVRFCPRILFKHLQSTEPSGGDGFEVTLNNLPWRGRIDGVRYRGRGDDMRLALSALGDSAYTLQPEDPDPESPDWDAYISAGNQTGRVVRYLF